MALRVACQALPAPGTQRHATNIPALMGTSKPAQSRGVAALASGNPFSTSQREGSGAQFWRPDCPPDESDVRPASFSVWPRKAAAKKVERLSAMWESDSTPRPRSPIEEVNFMNTRIQFRGEDVSEEQPQAAKRFNPLRLLGL